MKKGDFVWIAALLVWVLILVVPSSRALFISVTDAHPYAGGFIKFAILASMGDMLGKSGLAFFPSRAGVTAVFSEGSAGTEDFWGARHALTAALGQSRLKPLPHTCHRPPWEGLQRRVRLTPWQYAAATPARWR